MAKIDEAYLRSLGFDNVIDPEYLRLNSEHCRSDRHPLRYTHIACNLSTGRWFCNGHGIRPPEMRSELEMLMFLVGIRSNHGVESIAEERWREASAPVVPSVDIHDVDTL